MQANLNVVKWGLVLAMITVLLGFALGAAMGGAEEPIRDYWKSSAQQVIGTAYNNDNQKITVTIDRSWTALKRAHIHGAALGSAALIIIYLVSRLEMAVLYKQVISLFLGIGSLGYSFAWLYTAFKAPVLGGIPAAKASIHIVAAGSIGMLLLATTAVLVIFAKNLFQDQTEKSGLSQ